jgi:F0F1-type ATP synthase delta subunit
MNKIDPGFLRPQPDRLIVAKKYAEAFIKVCYPKPSQDLIIRFLHLYQICKLKKLFFVNLTCLKIALPEKMTALNSLREALNLEEADLSLLKLILQKGRIFALQAICKQIVQTAAKKINLSIFLVSTSEAVTLAQKDSIINFLNRSTTKNLLVIFRIDPALISGVRIESDCFLYEKSIKSRLKSTIITLRSMAE